MAFLCMPAVPAMLGFSILRCSVPGALLFWHFNRHLVDTHWAAQDVLCSHTSIHYSAQFTAIESFQTLTPHKHRRHKIDDLKSSSTHRPCEVHRFKSSLLSSWQLSGHWRYTLIRTKCACVVLHTLLKRHVETPPSHSFDYTLNMAAYDQYSVMVVRLIVIITTECSTTHHVFLWSHNRPPTQGAPQVVDIGYGCGSQDQKCTCTAAFSPNQTTVVMHGQGTSGTSTGLQFSCEFYVSFVSLVDLDTVAGCPCRLHLFMHYSDSTANYFEHTCNCLDGWVHAMDPYQNAVVIEESVYRKSGF